MLTQIANETGPSKCTQLCFEAGLREGAASKCLSRASHYSSWQLDSRPHSTLDEDYLTGNHVWGSGFDQFCVRRLLSRSMNKTFALSESVKLPLK